MKRAEIEVGKVYAVKVDGLWVPVRLDSISKTEWRASRLQFGERYKVGGGMVGTNLLTRKLIHIRTAAKLRYPLMQCEKCTITWMMANRSYKTCILCRAGNPEVAVWAS